MSRAKRSSDLIETHVEQAIFYGAGAFVFGFFAWLVFRFWGRDSLYGPLAWVLTFFGILCLGVAIYRAWQCRKVGSVTHACPYCGELNALAEDLKDDFTCTGCHRSVPVESGAILSVDQVRCGHCNALNYYSKKTEILLCEECNHEIPIALEDGRIPTRKVPTGYAVVDDPNLYELVLVGEGPKHEEAIAALQQLLALNRNQVKEMLENLPVTLLTGIKRRKAEMIVAQLSIHGVEAEFRPLSASASEAEIYG